MSSQFADNFGGISYKIAKGKDWASYEKNWKTESTEQNHESGKVEHTCTFLH